MKSTGRVFSLLLALTMIFALASCANVNRKDISLDTTTQEEQTTREYNYHGDLQGEDYIITETERETQKKHEIKQETTTKPKTPIKALLEKLPGNKPDKKEEKEEETEKKTVKVIIPSGSTMTEVFAILDASGVASFNSLMNAAHNVDFSFYPLIKAQKNTGRAFKLEGYLCSGKYTFEVNSKPEDAIGKMLRATESKITTQHRRLIAQREMSVDEVIIIASIIQKESIDKNEMPKISAVIQNRLADGLKLEMASCAMYVDSSIKPYLNEQNPDLLKAYNEYYNTFMCPALPAGPICTPSSAAIEAALHPQGEYRYFCVDGNGKYYYAETPEEHKTNMVSAGLIEPEPETEVPSEPQTTA